MTRGARSRAWPSQRDSREGQPFAADSNRVADGDEVRALRRATNTALSRWLVTHVELDSAVRRVSADANVSLEAHAGHLGALQAWQGAESRYLAARLGFRTEPLPSRRRA